MKKIDNASKEGFNVLCLSILMIVLIYRIYLCFQLPFGSDLIWHLGFAAHAFEDNFSIYQLTSDDFQSEFWSTLWPGLPYAYPPIMLIFFFVFAKLNLGFFWIKLTLTFIESTIAYLFYKISKFSALLFYCAPISLWNVSIKGQNDTLQSFFVALNVITIQGKKWILSGFLFAISIQVKLFGLLLLPWLAYEVWADRKNESFLKVLTGFGLGFIPFLGFYFKKPDLLLIPIRSFESTKARSIVSWSINPFEWTPWDTEVLPIRFPYISSSLTYILLIILVVFVILFLRKEKFRDAISMTPLISFIFVLKSLSVGRLWYALMIPGFTFCFSRRILIVNIVLVIYFMLGGRALISIIGDPGGHMKLSSFANTPARKVYQSCIFICDIKSYPSSEADFRNLD